LVNGLLLSNSSWASAFASTVFITDAVYSDTFDRDQFIGDSKNKMSILDLMSKYNLSLYQIRELRKELNLKRK